jgi:hypothetical protein
MLMVGRESVSFYGVLHFRVLILLTIPFLFIYRF